MKNGIKPALVIMAIALFGCTCTQKAAEKDKALAQPAGPVAIEVGTAKITEDEVKEEVAQLPVQLKSLVATKDGKKDFVDSLVVKEMFYQEALATGIDKDAKVAREIEKIKRKLYATEYLRKVVKAEEKADDATLKDFFTKNEKDFTSAERVHAKHILVKDEKVMREVQEKLKKDPKQFEKLAEKYSLDSSKKDGGDLGFMEKDGLVKEFADALDKLTKEGELSPVVKTQFGYHIIKFVAREAGKPPKFEDVKEDVRELYQRKTQKELYDKTVDALKKKYTVKQFDDIIGKAMEEKGTSEAKPTEKPVEKKEEKKDEKK